MVMSAMTNAWLSTCDRHRFVSRSMHQLHSWSATLDKSGTLSSILRFWAIVV